MGSATTPVSLSVSVCPPCTSGADGLTYFSPCRAGCVEGYEGKNSNEEENKVHSTCYIFGLVMVDIPVKDLYIHN